MANGSREILNNHFSFDILNELFHSLSIGINNEKNTNVMSFLGWIEHGSNKDHREVLG